MPIPIPLAVAGVQGASSIAGSVINAASTRKNNERAQAFAVEQYNRERKDNWDDMMYANWYNSPEQQMARLRQAGLNENLVYDNGASMKDAAMPRGANASNPPIHAPQIDLSGVGSAIGTYYDVRMKEAQTDNLKAQNTVLVQDALYKAALIANTNADTNKKVTDTSLGQFDLGFKQRMADTSAQIQEASLDKLHSEVLKTQADTRFTINQDERNAIQNNISVKKTMEDILTLRLQRSKTEIEKRELEEKIKLLQQDQQIKDADLKLYKAGVRPSDSAITRSIVQITGASTEDFKKWWNAQSWNGSILGKRWDSIINHKLKN